MQGVYTQRFDARRTRRLTQDQLERAVRIVTDPEDVQDGKYGVLKDTKEDVAKEQGGAVQSARIAVGLFYGDKHWKTVLNYEQGLKAGKFKNRGNLGSLIAFETAVLSDLLRKSFASPPDVTKRAVKFWEKELIAFEIKENKKKLKKTTKKPLKTRKRKR
jgi:hypothetical protein